MSAVLTTFLFEAANFLVLAGVLGWLFFTPVRKALIERRAKFEADGLEAAQKLAAAEVVEQQSRETRAKLQVELNDLRQRELETARRQAEEIVGEARAVVERQRELGRRQAEQMLDTQRDRLAEISAKAAAQTIGRLLAQIGGPELHSALIASACQQLRALPQVGLAPVKIESSQPLAAEQLGALKSALGIEADGVDFRTVAGLGEGIRVATGQGLVDASVAGLTQFASQALLLEMGRQAKNRDSLQAANHA